MLATARPRAKDPSRSLGIATSSIHAGGKRRELDRPEIAERKAIQHALKREAQRLLYDPTIDTGSQHRTCFCQRSIFGDAVSLQGNKKGGVKVAGVMVCDQPWTCPVCCIKIAQPRARDLSHAVTTWIKARQGNLVYLITYTFPHEGDQPLAELLELFYEARQRFANCRAFKRIREEHESPGVVRSTEVTVGRRNGFHPHLHELLFVHGVLTNEEKDELRSNWIRLLLKVGLGDQSKVSDMWERALDIRGGEGAAEYVAKFGREESWGISAELTRRHAKHGTLSPTAETYKPFALLALSAGGDDWAGARFREYAAAFKGKRLLTWSPGLRKGLQMAEDVPDDQVPEDEEYFDCVTVARPDWQLLLSRNAEHFAIEIVSLHSDDPAHAQRSVNDLVERCRSLPIVSRGDVKVRGLFIPWVLAKWNL